MQLVPHATTESVQELFDMGYTYAILGSDLFVLWKWAEQMHGMIELLKK